MKGNSEWWRGVVYGGAEERDLCIKREIYAPRASEDNRRQRLEPFPEDDKEVSAIAGLTVEIGGEGNDAE